jgi:DNA polymerase III gamma/tau subunit
LSYLAKKDAGNAIRLINKLVGEGVNLKTFLDDCIEFFRKLLLIKISPSLSTQFANEYGETLELKINETAKSFSLEQIVNYTEKFIAAKNSLKDYFIEQLPVELVIAEICASQPAVGFTPKVVAKAPTNPAISRQTTDNQPLSNFSNNDSGEVSLSIGQIMAKWNEVLAKIKQHNHSLSFILRVCQPRDISNNQLTIAFKYKFHKERVGEANIKNIVEQVIAQVYGGRIFINPVIDETIEVSSSKLVSDEPADLSVAKEAPAETAVKQEKADADSKGAIDNLLKTFGGRVVQ